MYCKILPLYVGHITYAFDLGEAKYIDLHIITGEYIESLEGNLCCLLLVAPNLNCSHVYLKQPAPVITEDLA